MRHVFRRILLKYTIVYGTAIYGRNTVPTKRVIYGPYTVVSMPFTVVYVNVYGCIRPFTVVVLLDLGTLTSTPTF